MTQTIADHEIRFWHSPEIDKIAGALAKAQGTIENASKDSTNPHFKSKYADLAAVMEACRKPLSANEIAIVQCPSANETELSMVTMLVHASGQFFASRLSMVPRDNSPQSAGSAITYARRYSLMAMAGIAPDDDDDGNSASSGQSQPYQRQEQYQRPKPPKPATPFRSPEPPAQPFSADESLARFEAEYAATGEPPSLTPKRETPDELKIVFANMSKDKRHFDTARDSYKERLSVANGAAAFTRLMTAYDALPKRTAADAKTLLLDLHAALTEAESKIGVTA